MKAMNSFLSNIGLFASMPTVIKTCPVHGIEYTEVTINGHHSACPMCQEAKNKREHEDYAKDLMQKQRQQETEVLLGKANIPTRFKNKTVQNYAIHHDQQKNVVEIIQQYISEFTRLKRSKRNMAFLGNAGTGKTHLACAIANHVIQDCGQSARFSSVAEINRQVREAKSFHSEMSESDVISLFAHLDLLIIDEVGMQSGTDAESRALFDVFNERYQQEKPTILISNLEPKAFIDAIGGRIADRIKEDGGELVLFGWASGRK